MLFKVKRQKKGFLDVYTGSTTLRKVSLIHLEVKVHKEQYK